LGGLEKLGVESCNFLDGQLQISDKSDMSAQIFNFAPSYPQMENFSLNCVFLDEKFFTTRNFFDALKFRNRQLTPATSAYTA